MGSTGNGRFGMYQGGGAGSMMNREKSGEIECPLEIENILLEDVAISEYFLNYKDVPDIGDLVELSMQLINKRLAVVLKSTQEVIGNLPVTYNYLNLCIIEGKRYSGVIKSSGMLPVPYIVVSLYA